MKTKQKTEAKSSYKIMNEQMFEEEYCLRRMLQIPNGKQAAVRKLFCNHHSKEWIRQKTAIDVNKLRRKF